MKRLLLIGMPFADVRMPSLALGLFKARFEKEGIGCDVEYLNFLFAHMAGWENYIWIGQLTAFLVGERMFARVYFGNDIPDDAEYFAYLGTHLTREDMQRIATISACVTPFLETCIDSIPWDRYDVIGFSSTFEQTVPSLALAYEIKRRFPGKVIVLGGANCEDVMGLTLHQRFPFVDYVCCGEADRSFPELVRRLADGRNVDHVPGIVHRTPSGSVATNPDGHSTDLNTLPFPNYDDYFRAFHAYSAPASLTPALLIETSRGCWWGQKVKCTFCGLNGANVSFRGKAPGRVLDEIDWITHNYNASYIRAVDNVLDPDYFETLLPQLASRSSNVRMFFEVRPTLRKEQVKMLVAARIHDVQVGIESLSTHTLHLMKKGAFALAGIQTLKWCKQYGIFGDWNIIFGFPGESPSDYACNLERAKLLTHLNPPAGVGRFRMDRFSTSFDRAAEMGFTSVHPHPVYRFIYPFSEETLSSLVYFFDFKYREEIDDGGLMMPLINQVLAWKARQDQLYCAPEGDVLAVYDTRPIAANSRRVLRGIQRDLLEYCDAMRTVDQLQQRLSSDGSTRIEKQEIKTILEEFVRDKLMIQEGSWYLSLPVMAHLA